MILKLIFKNLIHKGRISFLILICLTLGLIGQSLVFNLRNGINSKLSSNAKKLLASDFSFSARRLITKEENLKLENLVNSFSFQTKKTELIEVYSMVQEKAQTKHPRLSLICAIQENYPMYGEIILDDGRVINYQTQDLKLKNKVWPTQDLKFQLDLKIGSVLKIGQKEFLVDGFVKEDSTISWRGFSFAPYLYIHFSNLKDTGLISFGASLWNSHLYKVTNFEKDLDAGQLKVIEDKFDEIFKKDPSLKLKLPKDSSAQMGRIFNYLSDYLGLISIFAFILCLVGINYLYRNYLELHTKQISLMRVFGFTKNKIILIYIFQIMILSVISVVISLIFSELALPKIAEIFNLTEQINLKQNVFISFAHMFLICFLGLLSVIYPLLSKYLNISIGELFNIQYSFNSLESSFKNLLLYVPGLIFFYVLSIYTSQSIKIGSLFFIVIIIAFSVSFYLFKAVLSLVEKKYSATNLINNNIGFGIILRFLTAKKNVSLFSFLSVTIGAMLIFVILQIENSLVEELSSDSKDRPSLFLFDIQEEQINLLRKKIEDSGVRLGYVDAMVRGKILKINDENFNSQTKDTKFKTREEESADRFRNRMVNLTYSNKLKTSEKIIKGNYPTQKYVESTDSNKIPMISVEKRYASRLGIELNDIITFEILGVQIKGKVHSVRSVKWTAFHPNFFIVFEEGVIEDAPKTFLASVNQIEDEKLLELQNIIVTNFPNVSMINVKELMSKILGVLSQAKVSIIIMAVLCLFSGMFVMLSIVLNTIHERLNNYALFKILGLNNTKIYGMVIKEILLVIITSLSLSLILSSIINILLSNMFFDGVVNFDAGVMLLTFFIILLFSLIMAMIGIFISPLRNLNAIKSGELLLGAN